MKLSVKLCKTRLHIGVWTWAISPVKYVQETVRNCTAHLGTNHVTFKLPKKGENPFKIGYDPKFDLELE